MTKNNSAKPGHILQVWGISHFKTISVDGNLVDENCLMLGLDNEQALREAKERIQKYVSNLRFQLCYPDGTTVHFLSIES